MPVFLLRNKINSNKRKNGFYNLSNIYTSGMNQFKTEKQPFELINFISILIGIGAIVCYFFIPFYYSLLICIAGILLSVICHTRRISGIIVNIFSFFIILIIVITIFVVTSLTKFVKHNIIKKNIECNISEKIN